MAILIGVKIKITPTPEQAKIFDSWRVKARCLWNILLGIEQAAYDGSKFRPELKWRGIWETVVREGYQKSLDEWSNGRRTKGGVVKKAAGTGREPVEPGQEMYRKISGGRVNGEPPKLFIWDDHLQKIMARLKENPLSEWIGELPSHSAQQVCKDVCKAIKSMISEKKKRALGGGTDRGFPKFKRARYADGSVYMVNTQIRFDHEARQVYLPKMKTPVGFRQEGVPKDGRLLGGRIWREGEQWWLSCQFEIPDRPALPRTGKSCGLKISSKILATTFDGQNIKQSLPIVADRKQEARLKRASRRLSRREKGTKNYYEAADVLVQCHARERNKRDDSLHKISRKIVNAFDRITVHDSNVKSMMVSKKKDKVTGKVKRTPKELIKHNKNASMSKFRQYIKYKSEHGGRIFNETHHEFPENRICSKCGELHNKTVDAKTFKCKCGATLDRRKNAARNEFEQGRILMEATEKLKRA